MNRYVLYAIACIFLATTAQRMFGYAIYFVDKGSDPQCFNAPAIDPNTGKLTDPIANVVHIFIGKNPDSMDKYLRSQGIKEGVIQGLALSNEYAKKIAPYVQKGLAFIPDIGTVLSGTVMPIVEIHNILVVQIPKLFNKIFGGLMEGGMRKDAGIIAVQWNVPRGNNGHRALWNWKSIQDQYHDKPKGSTLYMTVMSKKDKKIIMYNQPFKTDEGPSFIVKDLPTVGCMAIPVNYNDEPIYMPVGPALRDKKFLKEVINRVKTELLPNMQKAHDPQAPTVAAELQRMEDIVKRLDKGLPPLPEQYETPVAAPQAPAVKQAPLVVPMKPRPQPKSKIPAARAA